MKFIADLHIHSRFSRACSKRIDVENLEKWAKVKGVGLLGTGDFTYKDWYDEIVSKTEEENGILKTKSGFPFLWQTEISLMYTQDEKGRRVHFVILAPSRDVVNQITEFLKSKGRIDYDGRPIFGFSAVELVENLMSIDKDIEVIPAHIWTSWFGVLGSKSGFDSFEECFKDQVKNIHALETGLSSDPAMNWRISSLDKFSIVSSSDAHSFWPWRLGRESTIFDCELNYKDIINAIRNQKISTIEVDPAYGKYHFDGHRLCNVCLEPKESLRLNGICPKCAKPLTIGVVNRVEKLADRDAGFKADRPGFVSLIPLSELISASLGVNQLYSKTVFNYFDKLIKEFGSEFNVLLKANEEDLRKNASEVVDLILKNREGKLNIKPGYDGVYGSIMSDGQSSLSNF